MKKTELYRVELSANTKTHLVNQAIQKFILDAKRHLAKQDIVLIVNPNQE